MNSWYHAVSAQKKWGGEPEDYIEIEEFIDSSKKIVGDVRHRSVYHHTEGVWLCQKIFGRTIHTMNGRTVPVRLIAERHIEEDLGWIPSPFHYTRAMETEAWMGGKQRREMSWEELEPIKEATKNANTNTGIEISDGSEIFFAKDGKWDSLGTTGTNGGADGPTGVN